MISVHIYKLKSKGTFDKPYSFDNQLVLENVEETEQSFGHFLFRQRIVSHII